MIITKAGHTVHAPGLFAPAVLLPHNAPGGPDAGPAAAKHRGLQAAAATCSGRLPLLHLRPALHLSLPALLPGGQANAPRP
jgi:hypothetical protein